MARAREFVEKLLEGMLQAIERPGTCRPGGTESLPAAQLVTCDREACSEQLDPRGVDPARARAVAGLRIGQRACHGSGRCRVAMVPG